MRDRTHQLERLVRGIVSRAEITAAAQGKVEYFNLHGTDDDGKAEHFGVYGVASATPPGCEAIRVRPKGAPDHPVAIAVAARQWRPTDLATGDVCLYNRAGDRVWLKDSGALVIDTGGSKIETGAGSIKLTVGAVSLEVTATGVTITAPTGVTTFT